MRKIRYGMLGLGRIFERVMADFGKGGNYELCAVAARDIERARAARQRYGAKYAFGSYEELAACDEVDIVYIATPHPFHMEHTLNMLNAGKHVICEKAFAMNGGEAEKMISRAREKRLFLMEAMWSRFFPAMIDIKARVDVGEFGDIRLLTANFGFASNFDAQSRIYAPALGGGALLDVGVYTLNFASLFLGARPADVSVNCVKAPTGTDADFAMQLIYDTGARAQLYCAVDTQTDSRAAMYCEKGIIDIPDFWHASRYALTRGGETQARAFASENEGHYHEFEHAAKCVLDGLTESPVMPLAETLDIIKLMTDMRTKLNIIYPMERQNA